MKNNGYKATEDDGLKSLEEKQLRMKIRHITNVVTVIFVMIMMYVGVLMMNDSIPKEVKFYIAFLVGIMSGMLSFSVGRYILRLIKKREDDYAYRKYLLNRLTYQNKREEKSIDVKFKDKSEKEINYAAKVEDKDIIALMLKNNDEITEYFKISKSHAKVSFWFSVVSCIVGLFALVIGVYGIVVLRDMSVSVISLISGSISELISGTIFWVHNKSALQLNHYYNALHENEKFLSAVNIADKLCDEKKEEILIEIIRKQIGDNKSVDLK